MTKIIQKDLSYKLIGILFDIHNELGNEYQEKYYQRAVEESFKANGLKFERELLVDLKYNGKKIGKYFLDFLVDGKVILEIKAVPMLRPIHFRQVLAYLKASGLELGILANFRPESLIFERVLNSDLIRTKNL